MELGRYIFALRGKKISVIRANALPHTSHPFVSLANGAKELDKVFGFFKFRLIDHSIINAPLWSWILFSIDRERDRENEKKLNFTGAKMSSKPHPVVRGGRSASLRATRETLHPLISRPDFAPHVFENDSGPNTFPIRRGVSLLVVPSGIYSLI